MKRIANLLVAAAAFVVLTNCASLPYALSDDRDGYERSSSDNAYNRYACRSYNYDARFCP